ncbi:MAG: FAD-binding oxidoreductase [Dehalococcoidales bacterium]|nr:FAD-binding oxidoreductase [Dehalococcoidales bacterium]
MVEKARLAKIVGADGVTSQPDVLAKYARDVSFVNPVKPACIVKPKSAKEVEKIVRLANKTNTPLVPVSSGPPHFRGDTVPGIGGAVVVDLSGMKKIIRIDRKNRVIMCEPGVTYGELIPAAAREGLRLNMPLMPRKTKSVIGSMLEREPVIMPKYHWDIADPLACVEVIFGNGEIFRTGAAAGPGTLEEQWSAGGSQKEAAGPGQTSLYRVIGGAQGTMGIVTWASLRCELVPTIKRPFVVGSDDIDKLFEFIHWIIRLRLVNECFVMNSNNLAAMMARKSQAGYEDIKGSLPTYVLLYNVAGYEYLAEERVEYQVKDVNDVAQKVGVEPAGAIGKMTATELLKVVNQPSADPYWKLRGRGACHDIFFVTIYDKIPGLIAAMYDLAIAAGYDASGMGIYLQPIMQGTNCHVEFNLFYDPSNQEEAEKVKKMSEDAVKSLESHGAFFSRPYGDTARLVVNRDAATVEALKRVKSIFDPNNIMNPGKLCF